ncbi:MAG: metallophosphoesterase [Kiritimatiellia bacterium]
MKILAISDIHYSDLSRCITRKNEPDAVLGRTLIKKTFLRLEHMGIRPDVTVLLGDLLQGDTHPSAKLDLIALKGELTRSGIPFLALPGNHDINPDEFNRIMGTEPGLHIFNGYGFIVYNDVFEKHDDCDTCIRTRNCIEQTSRIASQNPGLPLIALQHAPVYPSISSNYPYNPLNASSILHSYTENNILLSLSGHYHEGTPPTTHKGVLYHTVPALKNAPFSFSLIEIHNTETEIRTIPLQMKEDFIRDTHCHTEHAYCGTTTDTAKCIALSKNLGINKLCITEHAFQLYFPKKQALSFIWQSHPEMVADIWKTTDRGRMRNYHDYIRAVRSDFVKTGLELDLYGDGRLLLAPEDMEFGWDILVGAVHFIEGFRRGSINQSTAESLFIRDLERMLAHGVHVIAHPFRFFGRNNLETPSHLYRPVAELLAHYDTAAEINYHTHSPDPDFIRTCVACGVKLTLGSDTHDLAEAGEFYPHIELMKRAGIKPGNMKNHLLEL